MLDIILDTIKDTLRLLPFLFVAFLIIELFEHKLSKKSKNLITASNKSGPLLGSALGMFPQCGFSVLATNLYVTRIISLGTLISIYLSTSDEMLPILLSEKTSINMIIKILLIKFLIGMISGFIIDFILRNKEKPKQNYEICEDNHCHCDKENIVISAIKHTLSTCFYIFIISLILNIIISYVDEKELSKIFLKNNAFAPFISSLLGLIPNCASSVMLTELYLKKVLSLGTSIAGLLTGSGLAILILFRTNKNLKENLKILALIYFIGAFSGVFINIIENLIK